ncbi:RNA-binding E3 ubiquitin-protein ligase MEX3C-like [Xyrauchen texanus]|uniref:RNA-binding E3 ubiquitin-protein ligase MEX3C-like n=1 Tax=Xyrauchen texanus TaxID=154827 RepID=UPI0022420A95|nr:RNA-binding E3 ubiquitin-protein ligase MEX3C-like [Xyrauchen texanus]
MPSNAQLLESDDTEPDLPVLVQSLSGLSLLDDEYQLEPHDSSHLGVLGAVLDLQPLSQTGSEDETINNNIIRHDGDLDQLRARVLALELNDIEAPGSGGLFQDGLGESQGHQDQGRMMMLMMMMQEGERSSLNTRRKSVNTTECVMVPTSEHVAEIVGRQGCKIKALRAKTNTYIKTPVRGEEPVFVVTGRKEDVVLAKREILSAAEHFSLIRASRNKLSPTPGLSSIPSSHPGQTTIQVRVPYRMVGLVVGPKGATIKRIQQQTHTYIVTPSRDKEPVFEVSGMPENVDRAREEIEAHIALRTAGSVDTIVDDNDFHYNGKDVGFESGSHGAWLVSSGVSNFNANSFRINGAGYRNDSSSSLGSNSSESYYSGKGSGKADLSPTSPYGSGGATFWFGDTQIAMGSEESVGYDGLSVTAPSSNQQQTLWSTSLPTTPRLSPSLLARMSPSLPKALDHPLVRLMQENSQSLPAFGSAFSPSSDSTGSSSPPNVRTYSKSSHVPMCIRCGGGDNVAALVLGGANHLCPKCSSSILQIA